jgi:hypothetical protein
MELHSVRWFRGIRDGAALVRLAVKKPPQPIPPKTFYLDPDYAKTPDALKLDAVIDSSPGALGCLLIMCLVFLLPVLLAVQAAFNSRALSQYGVGVQAVVQACSDGKDSTQLTYRFTLHDGTTAQTYIDTAPVLRCLPENTSMAVYYLPDNPTVSTPAETFNRNAADQTFLPLCLGLIPLFLALVVISGTVQYIRGRRRYARLLASGIFLPGSVVSARIELAYRNVRRVIFYEFTAPDGEILRGIHAHARGNFPYDVPAAGTPVRVAYADAATHVML